MRTFLKTTPQVLRPPSFTPSIRTVQEHLYTIHIPHSTYQIPRTPIITPQRHITFPHKTNDIHSLNALENNMNHNDTHLQIFSTPNTAHKKPFRFDLEQTHTISENTQKTIYNTPYSSRIQTQSNVSKQLEGKYPQNNQTISSNFPISFKPSISPMLRLFLSPIFTPHIIDQLKSFLRISIFSSLSIGGYFSYKTYIKVNANKKYIQSETTLLSYFKEKNLIHILPLDYDDMKTLKLWDPTVHPANRNNDEIDVILNKIFSEPFIFHFSANTIYDRNNVLEIQQLITKHIFIITRLSSLADESKSTLQTLKTVLSLNKGHYHTELQKHEDILNNALDVDNIDDSNAKLIEKHKNLTTLYTQYLNHYKNNICELDAYITTLEKLKENLSHLTVTLLTTYGRDTNSAFNIVQLSDGIEILQDISDSYASINSVKLVLKYVNQWSMYTKSMEALKDEIVQYNLEKHKPYNNNRTSTTFDIFPNHEKKSLQQPPFPVDDFDHLYSIAYTPEIDALVDENRVHTLFHVTQLNDELDYQEKKREDVLKMFARGIPSFELLMNSWNTYQFNTDQIRIREKEQTLQERPNESQTPINSNEHSVQSIASNFMVNNPDAISIITNYLEQQKKQQQLPENTPNPLDTLTSNPTLLLQFNYDKEGIDLTELLETDLIEAAENQAPVFEDYDVIEDSLEILDDYISINEMKARLKYEAQKLTSQNKDSDSVDDITPFSNVRSQLDNSANPISDEQKLFDQIKASLTQVTTAKHGMPLYIHTKPTMLFLGGIIFGDENNQNLKYHRVELESLTLSDEELVSQLLSPPPSDIYLNVFEFIDNGELFLQQIYSILYPEQTQLAKQQQNQDIQLLHNNLTEITPIMDGIMMGSDQKSTTLNITLDPNDPENKVKTLLSQNGIVSIGNFLNVPEYNPKSPGLPQVSVKDVFCVTHSHDSMPSRLKSIISIPPKPVSQQPKERKDKKRRKKSKNAKQKIHDLAHHSVEGDQNTLETKVYSEYNPKQVQDCLTTNDPQDLLPPDVLKLNPIVNENVISIHL